MKYKIWTHCVMCPCFQDYICGGGHYECHGKEIVRKKEIDTEEKRIIYLYEEELKEI